MNTETKPSNIEQLLIDLYDTHFSYRQLADADECGDLTWHQMVTQLSPARGNYLRLLRNAFATGYALKRKYGMDK